MGLATQSTLMMIHALALAIFLRGVALTVLWSSQHDRLPRSNLYVWSSMADLIDSFQDELIRQGPLRALET